MKEKAKMSAQGKGKESTYTHRQTEKDRSSRQARHMQRKWKEGREHTGRKAQRGEEYNVWCGGILGKVGKYCSGVREGKARC